MSVSKVEEFSRDPELARAQQKYYESERAVTDLTLEAQDLAARVDDLSRESKRKIGAEELTSSQKRIYSLFKEDRKKLKGRLGLYARNVRSFQKAAEKVQPKQEGISRKVANYVSGKSKTGILFFKRYRRASEVANKVREKRGNLDLLRDKIILAKGEINKGVVTQTFREARARRLAAERLIGFLGSVSDSIKGLEEHSHALKQQKSDYKDKGLRQEVETARQEIIAIKEQLKDLERSYSTEGVFRDLARQLEVKGYVETPSRGKVVTLGEASINQVNTFSRQIVALLEQHSEGKLPIGEQTQITKLISRLNQLYADAITQLPGNEEKKNLTRAYQKAAQSVLRANFQVGRRGVQRVVSGEIKKLASQAKAPPTVATESLDETAEGARESLVKKAEEIRKALTQKLEGAEKRKGGLVGRIRDVFSRREEVKATTPSAHSSSRVEATEAAPPQFKPEKLGNRLDESYALGFAEPIEFTSRSREERKIDVGEISAALSYLKSLDTENAGSVSKLEDFLKEFASIWNGFVDEKEGAKQQVMQVAKDFKVSDYSPSVKSQYSPLLSQLAFKVGLQMGRVVTKLEPPKKEFHGHVSL